MNLNRIRAAFNIIDKATYLNNAYSGPLPRHVAEAATRVMNEKQFGSCLWDDWEEIMTETRKAIARLISASPEEIAFCRNTSEGLVMSTRTLNIPSLINGIIPFLSAIFLI